MEQEAYAIAVAVPITNNRSTALEILRGVAQAQNEINQGNKLNGRGLKVLIGDDAYDPAKAEQIAEKLVSSKDILAVVGHFSSDTSLAAVDVYQQHQLVMISPTSTSEDLSRIGNARNGVFFRTVLSDRETAKELADYLIDEAHQPKAAIFFDSQSNYSKSLREQFRNSFRAKGGQVIEEKFDLSDPFFKAPAALDRAQQKGARTLVLLPSSQTSSNAFLNATRVIKANQGRYLIVGGDSLYNSEILEMGGKDAANRLIVAIPWHRASNPKLKFPQKAKSLWRKEEVSWCTAFTYDATRALITALKKQQQPNRIGVQQALAAPTFQANGATGDIHFDDSGDRLESKIQLVQVVPANTSDSGYIFSPCEPLHRSSGRAFRFSRLLRR